MWIMTKDHLADAERDDTGKNSGEFTGYTREDGSFIATAECLFPKKWHKFKMYDDDGILYYEGLSSEEDFSPLDDFGMPNAGCTYIEYQQEDESWQVL